MSSELMKKISGKLTDAQGVVLSQLPYGITIELNTLASPPGPGGWIGSAPIKTTGDYELFTAYNIGVSESVLYDIYKDDQPVKTGSVLVQNNIAANIALTQDEINELTAPNLNACIVVKGNVTLRGTQSIVTSPPQLTNIPAKDGVMVAVPNGTAPVRISISKVKLRDFTEIVSGSIDSYGNYSIKIPVNLVNIGSSSSSDCDECCNQYDFSKINVSLVIKEIVDGKLEDVIIERVSNVVLSIDCNTVDIQTEQQTYFDAFYTELDYVSNLVHSTTGLPVNQYYTVTTVGDDAEINQISEQSGIPVGLVATLVNASKITHDYGIVINQSYALTKSEGADISSWTKLDFASLSYIINTSILNNITKTEGDINSTYDILNNKKIDDRAAALTDNGDTIDKVLGSLLGSEADIRTFLDLDNQYAESNPQEFWSKVDEKLPGKKAILQQGLQVLSITGMQPEMTAHIIDLLGRSGASSPPSLQPTSTLATYTQIQWLDMITTVSSESHKLCVPQAIIESAGQNGTDPKIDYSYKLVDVSTDTFASTVIGSKINNGKDADKAFSDLFGSYGTDIKNFLTAYPNFDFRIHNVWDIQTGQMPNIENVKSLIAPIQNIMRLTAGKPDAVAALMVGGMKSSADIAAISQQSFVSKYATVLGGTTQAQQVYTQANQTALVVSNLQTYVTSDIMANPIAGVLSGLTSQWINYLHNNAPTNTTSPDLTSLFGSIDSCNCSECMSMYSPAAYYTDIINFIQTQLGSAALDELRRRRPDLFNIDLSCKNSNTPLPYVDLVNEILERKIRDYILNPSTPNVLSYQTSGTAAQLAAYPEHTIKQTSPTVAYINDNSYQYVYDQILNKAYYPIGVPLNLAIEESRTYLQHLGYLRFDLMQQYKPKYYNDAGIDSNQTINVYNTDAEWLRISKFDVDIITKQSTTPIASPWLFYGFSQEFNIDYELPQPTTPPTFTWYEQLCNNVNAPSSVMVSGLRILLDKANITYKELLQTLSIDFLNPVLPVTINNHIPRTLEIINSAAQTFATSDQSICDLGLLKIIYGNTNITNPTIIKNAKVAFFDKLPRFMRLCRATGWSIYQLDIILMSLNATDIGVVEYKAIAAIHQLANLFGFPPENIASFWSNLSTVNYINYNSDTQNTSPSVYDTIFRNKSVINPNDPVFDNSAFPGAPSYLDHKGTIVAATNLTEDELDLVYNFVSPGSPTMTLKLLSQVYAISSLASGLRISIDDLLNQVFKLSNVNNSIFNGGPQAVIANVQAIADNLSHLNSITFSLDETDYILRNYDPLNSFGTVDSSVELFYETLRTDLTKQYDSDLALHVSNIETLNNIAIREFSTNFSLDSGVVQGLLQDSTTVTNVPNSTNISTAVQKSILRITVTTTGGSTVDTALVDVLTDAVFIKSQNAILSSSGNTTIPVSNGTVKISDLFALYLKTSKIALIVTRLNISIDEFVAILMGDTVVTITNASGGFVSTNTIIGLRTVFNFPYLENITTSTIDMLPVVPVAGKVILQSFFNLADWIQNRDRLGFSADDFVTILQSINNTNASTYLNTLVTFTDWDITTLTDLIGNSPNILGVISATNTDYIKASLLNQVANIMDSSEIIGLSPEVIYTALRADIDLNISRSVRQAAKAKYTDEQWASIAKPLQDVLREKQRQALLAYTVANPNIGDLASSNSALKWRDSNGVFAYYLIDVEMKPVMITSRIKQGISSLQLYILRIIQNLENSNGNVTTHINIAEPQAKQWEQWRKWYRVWEANREVFLYPENWMVPSLRDDKTAIFKELETQLQQDEVTNETAEEALRGYLEELDEVAKLEPFTAYHQVERDNVGNVTMDIKHVFSRTNSEPQHYYYRRLENNTWSPWEKITIDIKSSHIVPFIWNRRLYLFWLTYTPKQSTRDYNTSLNRLWVNKVQQLNDNANVRIMNITSDANQDDKQTTWDIKLNWSQYKDGKWLATEMCDDVMNLAPNQIWLTQQEQSAFNSYNGNDLRYWYFMSLSNNGELNLAELFKSRLYLSAYFETTSPDSRLVLSLMFYARPDDSGAMNMYSFIFPDPVSKPYVERWWERTNVLLSPIGTQAKNMKFIKIASGNQSANNKLKIERVKTFLDTHWLYCYNWYKPALPAPNPQSNGEALYPRRTYDTGGDVLLNQTPDGYGNFKLTRFGNSAEGNFSTIRDYFFFEDDANTYYVQKNPTAMGASLATINSIGSNVTSITLGQSGKAASSNYSIASSSNYQVAINANISSFTDVLSKFPSTNGSLQLTPSAGAQASASTPNSFTSTATQLALYSYSFQTFYHAQIHKFMKALNKDGVPGLLQFSNQSQTDTMGFGGLNAGKYQPTSLVSTPYPANNVQFAPTDPYSIYNWELFFHAPMLIAQSLSTNQQFEDAQKWYHYIFNPTSSTDGLTGQTSGAVSRFWKFEPFYKISTTAPQTLNDLLIALNDIANNNNSNTQVTAMQLDPFNPFVIARMRNLAFMKNVVMKYLDNLIAWGDQLFREDTIESINEATQIYILAANILGRKPESVPPRAAHAVYSYDELYTASNSNLGPLSNPLVNIESFFGPNTGVPVPSTSGTGTNPTAPPVYGKMFYFCIPANDILLQYWDTIADRLFKIRNSMNIEGKVQQLPIYDPPINPALLVRAAAMGIDISSIVDASLSAAASTSNYRFTYMLQKANEFCAEVRSLGGALLSALEKKDAEGLALLHSSQEMKMLDQITFIKQKQIDEAQAALDALNLTKESTQLRYDYYSSRQFTNNYEQQQLQSIQTGLVLQAVQTGLDGAVGVLSGIPMVHLQGLATGTSLGGINLAEAMKAVSTVLGIKIAINNAKGSMAGTMGGYQRRSDDWVFQTNTASKDLQQVDEQILGAQIRLDIANRELSNHQLQMTNAKAVDDFLRGKFTSQELYTWMSGQLSSTYFQSYQIAYDLAKKADTCYDNELPISSKYPVGGFITFGYWDSLKKGLLSGENLQFDLRRMEAAYMDDNVRELELTKHISLAIFSPEELQLLKETRTCTITIQEAFFDMDYPGHYLRRIKSVSISIPCIAGPYTTINCVLKQINSSYRKIINSTTVNNYPDTTGSDNRFVYFNAPAPNSIATSSAQNDSGVFELNFRDERYLPFENSGAISEWSLEFPSSIQQFDLTTISDVIMHIKYTARDSYDNNFKAAADGYTSSLIYKSTGTLLPRYFSMKHEFNNEWYKGFNTLVDIDGHASIGRPFNLVLNKDQYPEYCKGHNLQILNADFILNVESVVANTVYYLNYNNGTSVPLIPNVPLNVSINLPMTSNSATLGQIVIYKTIGTGHTPTVVNENELTDLFFVTNYKISLIP